MYIYTYSILSCDPPCGPKLTAKQQAVHMASPQVEVADTSFSGN